MFEVNVYVCVYFDLRAAEGPGGRGGGAKVGAGWWVVAGAHRKAI